MNNDDAVWAETTDGGLLRQLFGYYPTLHDAKILSIQFDPANDRVAMVIDYTDTVGEDLDQHLSVRIRLEWQGIVSLELPLAEVDLMGVDFDRNGTNIVTKIDTCGGSGKVVSERLQAVLVLVDPGEADEVSWIRYG